MLLMEIEYHAITEVHALLGVFVNVGSSTSKETPNGRGKILDSFQFEYLPIPEQEKTIVKIPTYRELGFQQIKFPDLPVHLDPEFNTFTYGHVERGYGDMNSLLRLEKDDALFFHATLQKDSTWSTYVIGYFMNIERYDCRRLSAKETSALKDNGFADNAHLKRVDPHVDLLLKGARGSKQLRRAFPLAEEKDHLTLRRSLADIMFTAGGKKIERGAPWFRWTLICTDCARLLKAIEDWQVSHD